MYLLDSRKRAVWFKIRMLWIEIERSGDCCKMRPQRRSIVAQFQKCIGSRVDYWLRFVHYFTNLWLGCEDLTDCLLPGSRLGRCLAHSCIWLVDLYRSLARGCLSGTKIIRKFPSPPCWTCTLTGEFPWVFTLPPAPGKTNRLTIGFFMAWSTKFKSAITRPCWNTFWSSTFSFWELRFDSR